MEQFKKIMKDFSIFGIVIVCFLGLFLYKTAVKADVKTISSTKLVQMIEADESFVVYTCSSTSGYNINYKEVVESYLSKNRSDKIYYVDLDKIDDQDTFVSTYLGEEKADLENPNTYVFVKGEIHKSKDAAIGFYDLTQLMNEFNELK